MNRSILFCAAIVAAVPACSGSGNEGSNPISPGVGGSLSSSGGAAALGSGGSTAVGGSRSVGGSVATSSQGSATGGASSGGQT
ncbi:MAG TPA: hypothetical protein VIV60_35040, partial [Polyangiaceae bacterium]